MTAFFDEEFIEELICWNMGFGIAPIDTIYELIEDGIEVPEYLIEQYVV